MARNGWGHISSSGTCRGLAQHPLASEDKHDIPTVLPNADVLGGPDEVNRKAGPILVVRLTGPTDGIGISGFTLTVLPVR